MTFLMVVSPTFNDLIVKTPSANFRGPWQLVHATVVSEGTAVSFEQPRQMLIAGSAGRPSTTKLHGCLPLRADSALRGHSETSYPLDWVSRAAGHFLSEQATPSYRTDLSCVRAFVGCSAGTPNIPRVSPDQPRANHARPPVGKSD
jgi:hypothetical protein